MSKSRGTFITARRYLGSFEARVAALLLRRQAGPGIEDMDLNLDEFATRLNSDHRRQARQHRQPLRRLHHQAAPAACLARRPARADPCTQRSRAAGRCDCGRSTRARDTASAMREIMSPRRSSEPVHRFAQALGTRETARQRRGGAERVHPGLESVPGADDLICSRCCRRWRPRRSAFFRNRLDLASGTSAACLPLLGTAIHPTQRSGTRVDPEAVDALIETDTATQRPPPPRRRRPQPRRRPPPRRSKQL